MKEMSKENINDILFNMSFYNTNICWIEINNRYGIVFYLIDPILIKTTKYSKEELLCMLK